jgi:hypothetical protein
MTKTCSICGVTKPIEQFGVQAIRKDGRRSWCRECNKVKRAKYLDTINANRRADYKQRRENILAERAAYYAANRDKVTARVKRRYHTKSGEIIAYNRERRRKNPKWTKQQDRKKYTSIKGTWKGFFQFTWNTINARTVNGSHPNPRSPTHRRYIDKGIRVEMTREEYRTFCLERKKLIEEMYRTGQRPSIDRMDSKGNYAIPNLRVIPLAQNCGWKR